MKQYICKNCATQLVVDESTLKATCPNCSAVFYLVDLETLPLRERLYGIVTGSGGRSLNRIVDIKFVAGEILNKNPKDDFGKFYFAFADRIMGNSSYLHEFLASNCSYDPALDKFNRLILPELVESCDGEFYDEVKKHLSKVVSDSDRLTEYLKKLDAAVRLNNEKLADYAYAPRDVYICNSSKDAEIAAHAYDTLKKNGISCFSPARNIRPCSLNYWQDVYHGIHNCRLFLVISSANAMRSEDCLKELSIASNLTKARKEFKIDRAARVIAFEDFFEDDAGIDAAADPKTNFVSAVGQIRAIVESVRANERGGGKSAEAEAAERLRAMEEKKRELEQLAAFAMSGGKGIDSDAEVMRAALLFAVKANFQMASGLSLRLRQGSPESVAALLTDICVSLSRLPFAPDEEKGGLMTLIKQYTAVFKQKFAVQTTDEKEIIAALGSAEVYALLAVTLFSIGEKSRRDYVITLIKPAEVFDKAVSMSYLAMLYREKNYKEIRRFVMNNPVADPNAVFLGLINHYGELDTKKDLLNAFAQKNTLTSECLDGANKYFEETADPLPVLVEVLDTLTKNKLTISGRTLTRCGIGDIKTVDHMMAVIGNLQNKTVMSADVDTLLSNADGFGPDALVLLMDFLQRDKGIRDIGQSNIRKLAAAFGKSKGPAKIMLTQRLLCFLVEPASKDFIVKEYLSHEYDSYETKAAVFSVLAMDTSLITTASYEQYLLSPSKGDTPDQKSELIKKLIDMTVPFSSATAVTSRYMKESADPDEVKRQIVTYFMARGFKCGDDVCGEYVRTGANEDNYAEVLSDYLMRNPAKVIPLFNEKLLNGEINRNNSLVPIFIARCTAVPKDLMEAFVSCYNGDKKGKYFLELVKKTSALKDEYSVTIGTQTVRCNLSQALAFTVKESDADAAYAFDYLKGKGIKLNEKVRDGAGKKLKPDDLDGLPPFVKALVK